jgi:hypothetical protein
VRKHHADRSASALDPAKQDRLRLAACGRHLERDLGPDVDGRFVSTARPECQ